MEKISEEISKQVISTNGGNIIGYIIDILFDEELENIVGYLVVDEESEEPLFLAYEKIISKSLECFMVQNENDLEVYISSLYNNPVGKIVYDEKGINLGKVKDVYFEKNKTKRIITDKCEFPILFLKKAGRDCLIFGKKKKMKECKVLFEMNPKLPKVYVQESLNKQNPDKDFPIKILANSKSLLGKKVTHVVLGLNNELIAKENDVVTKAIIQKARMHNRYNLLMFYTK